MEAALRVGKPDAVVPPVLAVGDQFKLALEERMIRVGYAEPSRRSIAMRRSCRRTRTRFVNGYSAASAASAWIT